MSDLVENKGALIGFDTFGLDLQPLSSVPETYLRFTLTKSVLTTFSSPDRTFQSCLEDRLKLGVEGLAVQNVYQLNSRAIEGEGASPPSYRRYGY